MATPNDESGEDADIAAVLKGLQALRRLAFGVVLGVGSAGFVLWEGIPDLSSPEDKARIANIVRDDPWKGDWDRAAMAANRIQRHGEQQTIKENFDAAMAAIAKQLTAEIAHIENAMDIQRQEIKELEAFCAKHNIEAERYKERIDRIYEHHTRNGWQ